MMKTKIEWCDYTWNPWRGCTKVSPGCANCYAETLGRRFGIGWGPGAVRVQKVEDGWREPFRWAKKPLIHSCGKAFAAPTLHAPDYAPGMVGAGECCGPYRPARVFALSMGDWLEGDPLSWSYGKDGGTPGQPFPVGGVPVKWLARMLDTIRQTPQLNWILVTKRPENFDGRINAVKHIAESCGNFELLRFVNQWTHNTPPKNVCIMASVENQDAADARIPHLLKIPARWHGISLEPLLGPVKLPFFGDRWPTGGNTPRALHWLVIGGESGARRRVSHECPRCALTPGGGAVDPKCPMCGGTGHVHDMVGPRPCNVEWIRSLVRQGSEAGCAVFVKQLGAHVYYEEGSTRKRWLLEHPKGGDPSEWTADLRVREWPEGL